MTCDDLYITYKKYEILLHNYEIKSQDFHKYDMHYEQNIKIKFYLMKAETVIVMTYEL